MKKTTQDHLKIFEILARQNEVMLTAYLRGILRDATLADDVAQKTWIIAWKKIGELRDPVAFPAWLRSIGRFEAMNALRGVKREATVGLGEMEAVAEAFNRWERATVSGNSEELMSLLEDCFDELPPPLHLVCREHYFQNLKAHEIAERNSLETNTVLKRLQRCREALRHCMNGKLALNQN